ncbi:MAG: VWA domain-containing protein [Bryobacterales bacterium]|nr:VWA domain-containing protein [Bryobacterales bacterium]
MFEWLFQYPRIVFDKGTFTFLSGWPAWLLVTLIVLAAGVLAWRLFWPEAIEALPREQRNFSFADRLRLRLTPKGIVVWALQASFAALVLFLLWRPGLEISALRSQQNMIAVLVDDSGSMLESENGETRLALAKRLLSEQILPELTDRFAVKVYAVGSRANPVAGINEISGAGAASQLGESLAQLSRDTANLPLGGVLLVSDGADNRQAISAELLSEVRARRVPVHTLGLGRTAMERDVEVEDLRVAPRTFASAKLSAQVRIRQGGFGGKAARLTLKLDGNVVANRELLLPDDARPRIEEITFPVGDAGAKVLEASIEAVEGEQNLSNNLRRQLINVDPDKPRILYVEGEPRWEMKFIRRAMEEEQTIELVSMLRTTQNKIYRQGVRDGKELEDGFPLRAEDLFGFSGIVIGTVESNWFTPAQLELIKRFVDERGGGLLMLGGRDGLGDGAYALSPLEPLLPVSLPAGSNSFTRNPAKAFLTARGEESLITRLNDDSAENRKQWDQLPELADSQRVGDPRPGATVLLETGQANRRTPLLATQRFGYGRTAVFATGGSWKWQMLLDHRDETHEIFWRQLLRWLVTDSPRQVSSELSDQILFDRGDLTLTTRVRDKKWIAVNDATVTARVSQPNGATIEQRLEPVSGQSGEYRLQTSVTSPGTYITEIVAMRGSEEVGRDSITFRREDGVAEAFGRVQNRPLLQALSQRTGGNYYTADDASKIASDMTYSEAGLTIRETRDLWPMPVFFLLLLALKSAEWLLRRRWGAL